MLTYLSNQKLQERSFAVLKLLDRRFSSLSPDFLNETARAMQNSLGSYLLSLSCTDEVIESARSGRRAEMDRRRQQFEELHRRDFETTFNFDEYMDERPANEEATDDADDAINELSQALSSQGL